MEKITYNPIGIIYSVFKESKGTPIQPNAVKESSGEIIIFDEYVDCLKDLEGFSHIYLIFHFNYLSRAFTPLVKPFLDDTLRGVFSTRAPHRPNSIGLSVVKLDRIEGNKLTISELDILDKTPLLDIKPYVPQFDNRENCRIGWLEQKIDDLKNKKDDGRFII